MATFLQSFGLVAIVLTCFGQTWGCSCIKPPSQSQFCGSSFVIRGNVVNETKIMMKSSVPPRFKHFEYAFVRERVYDVEVTEIFRKTKDVEAGEGQMVKISTAGNDGVCGRRLTVGEDYLISGLVEVDKLTISSCDWIEEFQDVTDFNQLGIREHFDCDCRVIFGVYSLPENEIPVDYCVLNSPSFYWAPDADAYCKRDSDTGGCAWQRA